jgi:uncharacterized membrane protein YjjB (DUF3815 family)
MREFVLAFLGSYAPAVLFNIERKNLVWAGLCGATGWAAYKYVLSLTSSNIFSVFVAAVVISLISEIMAKILKTPSTVFYIPSLFPIVPGISAYQTVLYIINDRLNDSVYKAIETLGSAGAISFGILLVSTFFRFVNTPTRNTKRQ